MPPERSKPRSVDGVPSRAPRMPIRRPEYRPDHELPAGEERELIAAHEPEVQESSRTQTTPVPAPATPVEPSKEQTPVPETTAFKPNFDDIQDVEEKKPRHYKKIILTVFSLLFVLAIAGAVAGFVWYQTQLTPVSSDTTRRVRVIIASGTAPSAIAQQLEDEKVIKNKLAFTIYAKLTGAENKLKAGTYSLQPSLSTSAIVDHLVSGKQDTFSITFLPGDTLANNRQKLIAAGYSAESVDAALTKQYSGDLFQSKPAGTDLEGYIFGDTYQFDASATPEDILESTFEEYTDVIKRNNLVEGFKKQGLTLYEGITLASIVQREVTNPTPSVPSDDQRQVARVFMNRMAAGMTLGSDVTYQYAAKKLGVDPTPTLDSPYNTRVHTGLPPGPIAVPGLGALRAVADPADNDYLFFLSGDDNMTYFATTDAGHEQNIAQHCQEKCKIN